MGDYEGTDEFGYAYNGNVFEDMQFDNNLTAQFINKTVSDLLYYNIDGLSLDFE
jgi:hypothetical protein